MHSYYHLIPLDCTYCSMGYLSNLVFYRPTGKHLALLTNVVSGFKSFGEDPHLAWKCGTRWSDSPVRAL
jgi:hypothetical protein